MRLRTLTLALVAFGFVTAAVGGALAQGQPDHHAGSDAADHAHATGTSDANETADGGSADDANATASDRGAAKRDAAMQRRAELTAARQAALDSFKENRTSALADYKAAINATRASFLENKTRVLEECSALRNATENKSEVAKCVRDGLKPLIEEARAAHKDARETFLERMLAARHAALEGFAHAKARAHAKYGAPQEG